MAVGAGFEWRSRIRGREAVFAVDSNSARVRLTPGATLGRNADDVALDEAFLSDLEIALERPHTRELQAFDALTPHVREISDQR